MLEETSNWMGDQPNGKGKKKMQQINQLSVHQLDNQSYTSTKEFIQIVNRYLITTVNIVISSKWKNKKLSKI